MATVRYPAAEWKPLASNWNAQPRLRKHDLVILHTAVGSLQGTYNYFKEDGYGGVESHFMLGHDGTVWQFQDTDYQAEANGAANSRAISIETADRGPAFGNWDTRDGAAVPAWLPAQVDALVDLVRWICDTHGIPKQAVLDSGATRRGIAYHRLGVPGFATGELWSSARGKVCPGPRRIAQIPSIIDRVRQEPDMPALDDFKKVLQEELSQTATRADVGWARNQVLTQLGVPEPSKAPGDYPKDPGSVPAGKAEVLALHCKLDQILELLQKKEGS